MSIWDSITITRFSQEGENDFAEDYPCILVRYSLPVVSGTSTYLLPDNIRSVRRITWQGIKLDPLGQRNFREVFQNGNQMGKPFWYVFNNLGANKIQLFPTPNQTINPSGGDLYSDGIATDVIIETYILPDYAANVVPSYFKRRLVKSYVLKMCFGIEGSGQNIKNSQYFDQRYKFLKEKYGLFLHEIHNKSRKLCLNGISSTQYFPGSPMLPISRFGIGIGDEI